MPKHWENYDDLLDYKLSFWALLFEFKISLTNMGHNLQNELWASPLAVILAHHWLIGPGDNERFWWNTRRLCCISNRVDPCCWRSFEKVWNLFRCHSGRCDHLGSEKNTHTPCSEAVEAKLKWCSVIFSNPDFPWSWAKADDVQFVLWKTGSWISYLRLDLSWVIWSPLHPQHGGAWGKGKSFWKGKRKSFWKKPQRNHW